MKISAITIHDFRCFEKLRVNLDPQVNVFVGNNGAGKSAILDAIAGGLFPYVEKLVLISGSTEAEQPPLTDSDLRVYGGSIARQLSLEVQTDLGRQWAAEYRLPPKGSGRLDLGYQSPNLQSLWDFLREVAADSNHKEEMPIPVVAYYGGSRNLSSFPGVSSVSKRAMNRFSSFRHALDASANYGDVAEWWFFREVEELREGRSKGDLHYELGDLAEVRRAIATMVKPAAKVFFHQEELMVRWEGEDGHAAELKLSQLSNGFRNMLALVMDFARRMAQANPNLKYPLQGPGILLIDEIDLHIHPTWQQQIVPDLRKVFPNTQLIVTTHSPEVVTTVQREQVQILDDYQVLPCPNPTYGAKTSDVVRSVLGLPELRPDNEVSRDIALLFQAIDRGNLDEAKTIREKLRKWDNEGHDPDLTRADVRIRWLEQKAAGA